MFDVADHLDGLRCRETSWLLSERDDVIREKRRLEVRELALTRVLDERGALGPDVAVRDGVSERTARTMLEMARALESLPEVAAAAYEGRLSPEQLAPLVELADEASDAEWARRAPRVAPTDLARLARTKTKPTAEDARQRRDARSVRMWWTPDQGMLHVRGELPDVMGAQFEATIQQMTDRMRPPTGQPWDTYEHRAADALVSLCDRDRADDAAPTLATKPLLVVQVPVTGPAEVAGIPLPDAMVEQLRANARIEPVLVDDDGTVLTVGKQTTVLSAKILRAVLLRDGHCRCGCDVRHGLHAHHLRPRSWGGSDDPSNLAMVCISRGHHQMLVPTGPWALVGNPNRPGGLRLAHLDRLTPTERQQLGLPATRAGPTAA